MRVLHVGSNGYLGKKVVRALKAKGHFVRAFVREKRPDTPDADEKHIGDVLDRSAVGRATQSMDAIVSTVEGYQRGGTIIKPRAWETDTVGVSNLIEFGEQASVRRFVYMSIVGCHLGSNAPHIRSKPIIEERLRKSSLDWVSVRSPLIMDEVSDFIGNNLRKGFMLCFGSPKTRYSAVLSDQVAEALAVAVEREDIKRETIDVVWEEDVCTAFLAERFTALGGRPIKVRVTPWRLARAIMSMLGLFSEGRRNFRDMIDFFLAGKFVGDPAQTRRLLGRSLSCEASLRDYLVSRGLAPLATVSAVEERQSEKKKGTLCQVKPGERDEMPALYRRLLGADFDRLPPTLRDFHDVEGERCFRAAFRIRRGRGWLRRFVCWLGRLPQAGEDVPLCLRVVAEGQRERWLRDFGGHRLESVQWAEGSLLMESLGLMRLAFRLEVEGPALRLETIKAWLLGIRWPLWLAPRGSGVEIGQDNGCAVVVRVEAPLLGLLVQYEGLVVPDCEPAADHIR